MCGIVGAVAQRDIAEILLEGLRRLEYRGYDSAGLAVVDNEGHMNRVRRLGKVQMLAQALEEHPLHGGTGIAHTRWATHGEPSEGNAHPHISDHIVVVHNGIIENHEPLRELLQSRGYVFASETDTEVIAHLVHWELEQGGTLRDAVLRTIPQLRGAYGTVIMDSRDPGTLLAARSGSPLVIGLGMGENFIASDQLALLPVTRRFIFLEEGILRKSPVVRSLSLINPAPKCCARILNPVCSMMQAIKVSIATICRKRSTSSRTRSKIPSPGALATVKLI